jgi:4-methyl-5(b-hydroxyethyl)-thiazole monophosphate biosynthesis
MEHKDFLAKLSEALENGVKIGAICAAPSILGRLGLLKGKKAVSYPGFEKFLEGAEFMNVPVITDGNITTSRGAGTALEFGFELLSILEGDETANSIKEKMVYN